MGQAVRPNESLPPIAQEPSELPELLQSDVSQAVTSLIRNPEVVGFILG
jgi:hypothetical protein